LTDSIVVVSASRRCAGTPDGSPVRYKAAAHADELLAAQTGSLVGQQPVIDTLCRYLPALLADKWPATRTHATRMLAALRAHAPVSCAARLTTQAQGAREAEAVGQALSARSLPEISDRMALCMQTFAPGDLAAYRQALLEGDEACQRILAGAQSGRCCASSGNSARLTLNAASLALRSSTNPSPHAA
jgi:hypothetical protein